MSSSLLS